jgi:hypothetical protein
LTYPRIIETLDSPKIVRHQRSDFLQPVNWNDAESRFIYGDFPSPRVERSMTPISTENVNPSIQGRIYGNRHFVTFPHPNAPSSVQEYFVIILPDYFQIQEPIPRDEDINYLWMGYFFDESHFPVTTIVIIKIKHLKSREYLGTKD